MVQRILTLSVMCRLFTLAILELEKNIERTVPIRFLEPNELKKLNKLNEPNALLRLPASQPPSFPAFFNARPNTSTFHHRPLTVLGRKNWLFSGHPRGAEASAFLYSFIETAKANGLKPYSYLRYLFDQLPWTSTEEDYRSLLPPYLDPSRLNYVAA